MANTDSINSAEKSEIAGISDELHDIASRLAGFEPVLKMLGASADAGLGNSLEMMAGMSQYINENICRIADRLSGLDSQAA